MTSVPAGASFAVRAGIRLKTIAPGLLLAGVVAAFGVAGARVAAPIAPVPAMVVALFVGMALHRFATRPEIRPGIAFCVQTVLRWGVALLGLRTSIGDVTALGLTTVGMVIASMILTIGSGFAFARLLGLGAPFGALAGAGTAVCGASAALATSTVLPDYKNKQAEIVFAVVAFNAFATVAMVLYPPLCVLLGFDPHVTGVMLGATIHDVAQVVGSAYPISEATGNTAVIVKLFRVFLLFPVVIAIGWWFTRGASSARVPVPVFALVFVALAVVNSFVPSVAVLAPAYAVVQPILLEAASIGLLLAIGALGLSTSITAIASLGWRHIAAITGTSAVILAAVLGALLLS